MDRGKKCVGLQVEDVFNIPLRFSCMRPLPRRGMHPIQVSRVKTKQGVYYLRLNSDHGGTRGMTVHLCGFCPFFCIKKMASAAETAENQLTLPAADG